jgi:hypothetical protein
VFYETCYAMWRAGKGPPMFCQLGDFKLSLVTCCFLDKYLANVKFRMVMDLFLVNYSCRKGCCVGLCLALFRDYLGFAHMQLHRL